MTLLSIDVKRTPAFNNKGNTQFDRPHLVLVEGPDDQAFIASQIILARDPAEWHVHFMEGNATDWKLAVEIALDDATFRDNGQSITLVRDADRDAGAVVSSLQRVFEMNALPVPGGHGDVARSEDWSTSLYIMPDGSRQGALEELLIESIAEPHRYKAAAEYISGLASKFAPQEHPSKSVLQAYLAGQTEFTKWISMALTRDMIPRSSPAFQPIRDVLVAVSTA